MREKSPYTNGLHFLVFKLNTENRLNNRPNTGKYGPEITSYLNTFHAMIIPKRVLTHLEGDNLQILGYELTRS